MAGAIAERQHAEDHQRGDLDDVDGDVDGRGSAAPLAAIQATKKEKTTATSAMNIGPGLEPLMTLG